MRLLFAAVSAVVMFLLGRHKCLLMKKRAKLLREIELFLKLMRPRTEYLHEAFYKTVEVLSKHSGLSELQFLRECAAACDGGTDFPKAWADAVKNAPLKRHDTELLLSFGEAVSSANTADVSGIISLYEASFQSCAEEARERAETDSKMYMSVFSAIGILLGIIIV